LASIWAQEEPLVADPALENHGLLEAARKSLAESGLEGKSFLKVEPEPYLDNADDAAAIGREMEADLVIGMGGGSAMDTAKAAAALVTNDGKAGDYIGLNKVELPSAATIMIPTAAGTSGSDFLVFITGKLKRDK
jgi:alcohol dehydrogenase